MVGQSHIKREMTMLRNILVYGVIGGIIVGIPTFTIPWQFANHIPDSTAMLIGYASMLIALTTVFLGVKQQRDTVQGGVIRFLPALGMGLAISVVAGIFYVLAWELVLAVTHMDFAGDYAKLVIAQQKAKGVSGAALARTVAQMEEFKRSYASPFYRMPMTFTEIFPVGVLVSLVSAGLLRNSRFLPARRATSNG
jgi:hypothetical protein